MIEQGTHLHVPRMLHDVLEIFIAGQPRELMGNCDLPVNLGVPPPGVDQACSSLGRKLVHPLVLGLEDLLNWLRVGSHLCWTVTESEPEWMIVDDSFGSSKCTHTSSPGSLFCWMFSTGAFKIRKKQIGSAGVETVKE